MKRYFPPRRFPQKVTYIFQAIRATFHIHTSWQNRRVSFPEVNCPNSMSANSAASRQGDISSFTLRWTDTIKHESARRTLAEFQGEDAAFSQRRLDVWQKGRREVTAGYETVELQFETDSKVLADLSVRTSQSFSPQGWKVGRPTTPSWMQAVG